MLRVSPYVMNENTTTPRFAEDKQYSFLPLDTPEPAEGQR